MKKILNIIKNILSWALVVLSVFMMIFTIVSKSTLDRSDRSIFGYKAFIVLSDSMSATDFNAGDVVVMKEVDPATLKVGDIISYTSQNRESFGETITHKIREITTDAEGNPGFITYGTTTDKNDDMIVTYPFVSGKHQFSIPKLGVLFQFLQTTPGYIICILIPFMTMIIMQGIDCIRLFNKYKDEQYAEDKEERKRLEEELSEAKKKMEELMKLKEDIASNNGISSSHADMHI